MPVTEVGLMGVKPGLNVMDETTPEGQILTGAWKAVIAAPGGPHRVYWGLEVEDPSKLWAFFDWDSIEDHEKFAKSFGGEAVKDFPTILTHGEFTKHIALAPFPPLALQAPVTEILVAFFPSDITQAGKDVAVAQAQQFLDKGAKTCSDIQGVSYGWGVENDFPVRGEDGQMGAILAALIGWPSIDAHIKFRETDAFKQNVHYIRSMDRIVKMSASHVSFQTLGRKTE